jgi:hypothetical protein
MNTNIRSTLNGELKWRMSLKHGRLDTLETVDLAVRVEARNVQTSGVSYIRHKKTDNKDKARKAILRLFSPKQYPNGLSILTMPSMFWLFERGLLGMRETSPSSRVRPKRTYICAIEKDEAIYRAGIQWMPGADKSLAQLKAAPYASHTMRTFQITRFHRCELEKMLQYDEDAFDAAWLDFNGQITTQRLEMLTEFWRKRIKRTLAITARNNRYDGNAVASIKESGSVLNWIAPKMAGGKIIHYMEYRDTSPMIQMAFERY